jgi:uncharacterized delta-60 repeat protein
VLQRLFAFGTGWALLASSSALAAPGGELDALFGENGRLSIQLADESLGWAIAQQPDAKLLVGGATLTFDGAQDFAIVRVSTDGRLDSSFDSDGVAIVDFAAADDVVTSLIVQPSDGKILAAGWANVGTFASPDYDFALVRLNPDGSLDSTFGGDGLVVADVGGSDDSISGLVLLGNGQIVVAGYSDANGDYDVVFARFNSDGSRDPSFGTNATGLTFVDSASGTSHDQPFSLSQQRDGKFIACGLSGPNPYNATNGAMLAVRLNADGSVDTTYGSNGVALVQTASVLGTASSCVASTDGSGSTLLGGFDGDPGAANLAFARLDANGNLDPSFGMAGQRSIDLGGTEIVQSIIELSDGAIGVTGLTATIDDNVPTDMFFARIDPDTGSLDPTFGNDGVTTVDFGAFDQPSLADGLGLIQQADGKLVAVGTSLSDLGADSFAVARVNPAGTGSAGYAGFVETFANVVGEGTANVVLTVRRTGGSVGSPGPVSVAYSTVGGTATAGSDFTAISGVLQWFDGDMSPKTITVPITDDTVVEVIETFSVILNNTTGTVRLAASELTVSLADTDQPPPAPPPSGGGGGGGGGLAGIELLALLGLLNAFAWRRSGRRCDSPPSNQPEFVR